MQFGKLWFSSERAVPITLENNPNAEIKVLLIRKLPDITDFGRKKRLFPSRTYQEVIRYAQDDRVRNIHETSQPE